MDFAYAGSPVPPEADIYLDWEERTVLFPDGEAVELRSPKLRIENLNFGPYTDMLLHDMGDELADGRPDFLAGPRDWRTPPLWGLGLSQTVCGSTAMLHDRRVRTVADAILWHGGEATRSRESFRNMPKADREALVKFVDAI